MTGQKRIQGAFLLVAFALCTGASAEAPATDDQRSAAELKARAGPPAHDLAQYEVWSGPGFRVLSNQRTGPGEVEVHAKVNDVFVIEEGQATMLVGGRVEGSHETAPNEMRGGRIIGGHSRKLSPGDVLWVPAGEPHQIIPESGISFRYEVIKVEARAPANAAAPAPPQSPRP